MKFSTSKGHGTHAYVAAHVLPLIVLLVSS